MPVLYLFLIVNGVLLLWTVSTIGSVRSSLSELREELRALRARIDEIVDDLTPEEVDPIENSGFFTAFPPPDLSEQSAKGDPSK